ncbi:MAG TPA: aspartate 1-decarboxylase [Gammaproteobacteria bacterium]|nr:aspartate 1-decarboxylase [Gammaproteobacteria bacterium]
MQSTMLKCKLHRARVTQVELEYEGSCAIDGHLLESAGIREYEQIHIYNITNGERFVTYAIRAEEGSGVISINGGAARRAAPGDIVVICAYVSLAQQELVNFKPTLVYLDEANRITHIKNSIPVQAA